MQHPSHPADLDLVYGLAPDLIFIPRLQAERLAMLWHAATTATTWGELRRLLPAAEAEAIADLIRDNQAQGWVPQGDAPFSGESVYGGSTWHGWPQQEMLSWIPREIQEQFGSRESSFLDGEYLVLAPLDERAIVDALIRHGYRVAEDQGLVRRACGDLPGT